MQMDKKIIDDKDMSKDFFCSPIAKVVNGNIFISQYRFYNSNFPNCLILSPDGKIVWQDLDISKKYKYHTSNLTYDNHLIICARENDTYYLIETTLQGKEINRINLSKIDLKNAYYIEKTKERTYLISSVKESKVVEIDMFGNLIFHYKPGKNIMSEPRHVCKQHNKYIISDSKRHYIFIVDKDNNIISTIGKKDNPGYGSDQLLYPYMTKILGNGHLIFCEHQKNRITEIDENGNVIWIYGNSHSVECQSPRPNILNGPTFCDVIKKNEFIVSDSMNGRILLINKLNQSYKVVFGIQNVVKSFILNFPRSVQLLNNNHFLIADSRNNRILEIDNKGEVYFEYGNENSRIGNLKWPRCVYKDEIKNMYYISDGFNRRILILNENKNVLKIIRTLKYKNNTIKLFDPHSIIMFKFGYLLITDSELGMVAIIDLDGNIKWMFEDSKIYLSDPHYANIHKDLLYISDTNNNRIVVYSFSKKEVVRVITEYSRDYNKNSLNQPKWFDILNEKKIVVMDSKNNRLILLDISNNNEAALINTSDPVFFNSRWACRKGETYYISDFWRHCLVKYVMEEKSEKNVDFEAHLNKGS